MRIPLILCLLCLLAQAGYGQKNIVKWNVAPLLYLQLSPGYERVVGKKVSLACYFNYHSVAFGNEQGTYGRLSTRSFGVVPELRWYPWRNDRGAPYWFYLGAYCRYGSRQFKVQAFDTETGAHGSGATTVHTKGFGLMMGLNLIAFRTISIDPFFGLENLSGKLDKIAIYYDDGSTRYRNTFKTGGLNLALSGLVPRVGLSLGVAF